MIGVNYMAVPGLFSKNAIPDYEIVQRIIKAASEYYKCPVTFFRRKSNERKVVEPRQVVLYLIRSKTSMTVTAIGNEFNLHYSSVIHSAQRVSDLLDIKDEATRNAVTAINGMV